MSNKSYSELVSLKTFDERFKYLKLDGAVGKETFGYDRYLNQVLYNSSKWRSIRSKIIARDMGCDLGVEGYDINKRAIIHHINPITLEAINNRDPIIFDPENLITTTHRTHNAIHYGDIKMDIPTVTERSINDTCPWRH